MAVYKVHLLALFVVLSTSSKNCLASPWVWACDEQTQTCSRVLRSQVTSGGLDLMACKMTCSDQGLLWPLPAGEFHLSKTLVPVATENSVQLAAVDAADQQSEDLVTRFYNEVFFNYLTDLRKVHGSVSTAADNVDVTEEDDKQGDDVVVLISVEISQRFEHLNLETDESYSVVVGPPGGGVVLVAVSAASFYGARHGLEAVSQLISWNDMEQRFQIHSEASILDDSPAYPHRGFSIDTSRNFLPVPVLKKMIDGMAMNKLNTFHWHISDDHSFPLSLPSLPQLAEFGAYHDSLVYTPEDASDLIDYAMVRGVRIVPEIDMPAHTGSGWLFGAEEGLGNLVLCSEELHYGGPNAVLNPVNDNLYDAIETMFVDLASLFPSDTVHLGGDEVNFGCWSRSEEIVEYFDEQGLDGNDEDMFALWANFQEEVAARLVSATGPNQPKRKIIWTSALTDDGVTAQQVVPSDEYIIQIWSESTSSTIPDLLSRGYKVVMSHWDQHYLDCGVGYWGDNTEFYCHPYKQWRAIYDFDLRENYLQMTPGADENLAANILGGEAAIWSELNSGDALNIRLWPRGCALAERLWTRPMSALMSGEDTWVAAEKRFLHQRERMVQRGVAADQVQMQWCHQNEGVCNVRCQTLPC